MGDTSSELHPAENISEFFSRGPKNYAYRVLTGDGREKTVCKVRGITLSYYASNMVDFEVIRDMILRENKGDENSVVKVHTEINIKRKRKGGKYLLLPKQKTKYIGFNF